MKYFFLFIMLLLNINSFSQVVIYMNKESGIYTVPCKINGLKLKFIFDTGATNVSISLTEAIFMLKNNYISENEIYGKTYAQLANGDITETTQILLREVEIAGIKIDNVKATVVAELAAPLLLGQSAIAKLGPIQLEGNKLTILTKRVSSASDNSSDIATYDNTTSSQRMVAPEIYSNYSRYSYSFETEVYTCAAIYNKCDQINGTQIGSACDGNVTVLGKIGEDYYYVSYKDIKGYIHKSLVKK